MATKKSSKKTEEKVEEAVVEEKVEAVPVEEPAPAPKAEKKSQKKTAKAELPEMVGYDKPSATFVEEVHQALLGRKPSEKEAEYFLNLLDVKGFPLPEVVRQVKMSGEYQATLPVLES